MEHCIHGSRERYGDHERADGEVSLPPMAAWVRGRHFSGMIPDYESVEGVHGAFE
jgi:hypothetical protein